MEQVWSDMKSRTKKKAAATRSFSTGTGGGILSKLVVSETDERILALLVPKSLYGFGDDFLPGESGTLPERMEVASNLITILIFLQLN